MTIDLSGKGAVITGAGRGLGEATSVSFADSEWVGGTVGLFIGDVTSQAEVTRVASEVRVHLGAAQILINNAGTKNRKPLIDFSLDEFRSVIDSSLISMARRFASMAQQVLRHSAVIGAV